MQESFGDYKVLERVGAGSKAEVFRARDTRAGRTAAIKVLTSDIATDPLRGQPIADEAFLAVKLSHPNAATLYEVGEQDGRPHLVYEFIQGQTLKTLLGGHAINPRRALEFATQIADTLAEAHAIGLAHRALRPDKVIVSQKGTAKTTDFGLGRYATAVALDAASTGAAVPGMAYWAPEQRTGEADQRADIYALGLILVEMLTGQAPVPGNPVPDLSGVMPLAAPLVRRLLEPDPDRRIDSAATVAAQLREMAAALDAQRDAPATAPPPAPPAGKPARRPSKGVVVSKPAPPAPTSPPPATPAAMTSPHAPTASPRPNTVPGRVEPVQKPAPATRPGERPRSAPSRGTAPPTAAASNRWVIAVGVVVLIVVLWFVVGR